MEKFCGIDVGGTNVKLGIVDLKGNMEYKIKYPTINLIESGDFVGGFLDILEAELSKFPDIHKVGIGVPGLLSKDRSILLDIAAIPVLNGVRMKEALLGRFPDKTFHLENDANSAALGEYYFSGVEMPENYLFITLGTGIGSAAIIDHQIFQGGDGNGMEMGHILADNGKSLEQNIGKKGIMKQAEKLMKKKNTDIAKIDDLDPKKILRAAESGDKVAEKIFMNVGHYLGEALVSTIRILDIKTVLVGGGLAPALDIIKGPALKVIKKYLTPYYVKEIDIRRAVLGNNAGIVGAASLCFM
jgi:glucokinase